MRLLIFLCLVCRATSAAAESLSTALGGVIRPEWQFDEARQYDFWIGEWRANWRQRTVWTTREPNCIAFDHQRRTDSGDWLSEAAFEPGKRTH